MADSVYDSVSAWIPVAAGVAIGGSLINQMSRLGRQAPRRRKARKRKR